MEDENVPETPPEESGKENPRSSKNLLTVVALCLLVALLVFGVNRVFAMLAARYPKPDPQPGSASVSEPVSPPAASSSGEETGSGSEEAPQFCPSCGRELHEGFQWGQYCPWCGEQVI